MKNKYTIQILGTLETSDCFALQETMFQALQNIEGLTVKAVSTDLWCDPNGVVRTWDDNGNETTPGYITVSAPTFAPSAPSDKDELEAEEVKVSE